LRGEIIDGKAIAEQMRADLSVEIEKLKAQGTTPGLAVVLVGEDPASQVYVRMKGKACEKLGMHSETIKLPENTSEAELLSVIDRLNKDPKIHGFLVQLPLPKQIDEQPVLLSILPEKDVDGFHPVNVGKVAIGDPTGFRPATPYGVQQMLIRCGATIEGAHVVIMGRSNLVGRPLAALLTQKAKGANATVTMCHSRTKNIAEFARQADILVAAMGMPEFVGADMIKPGAIVIDVGTSRVDDPSAEKGYRIAGDVDFNAVLEVASAVTPVPGGVGPMTITMLLYNTVQAARQWAEA